MKNLLFVIAVFNILMLSSCELEYLETDHPSCDFEYEGSDFEFVSSADILAAEKAALFINWRKRAHMYFKNPIEYKDMVIFFDRDLHSVDIQTGIENWSLDVGYLSSYSEPIRVEDKLYFITDNTIYGVNLNSGELVLEYKWKSTECISTRVLVHEDVMYLSLHETNQLYSAIASCPMRDLHTGEWTYFNHKITAENDGIYTSIKKMAIVTNERRQKTIFAITCKGNIADPGPRLEGLEAFSLHSGKTEWVLEEDFGRNLANTLLTYENQIIIRGSGFVMGLNTNTGEQVWKNTIEEESYAIHSAAPLHIYENMLLVFSDKAIATAFDLDNNGTKLWQSNPPSNYVQLETGIAKNSLHVLEDEIFYISVWGYIMEIDLSTGMYTRHHEKLTFEGGMIVTQEKEIIALPQYEREIVSFLFE